ncbi:uncharacterized protein LOC135826576 [Sycon ciliatum]|uniref:uncharacterized protein LOC135826576 n=1 Tax=Sycon ciliatum TaxID=27933 RepID=UPI0031F65AAF
MSSDNSESQASTSAATASASPAVDISAFSQLPQLLQVLIQQQQQQQQHLQQQTTVSTALLQHLSQPSQPPAPASVSPRNFPKLQPLEDTDDAEAWFLTAERLLIGYGVPPDRRALAIVPHLKGKARSAYNNLPVGDSKDFVLIRTAVLARFRLDAEEYRLKFRSINLSSPGETYMELHHRQRDLFEKWITHAVASGGTIDVPFVTDQIVREQLLSTLPAEVRRHVQEQPRVSATDTAKLADAFARAQADLSRTAPPLGGAPVTVHSVQHRGSSGKPTSSERGSTSNACGYCGGKSHARSACPAREKTCNKCNKRGHYGAVCRSSRHARALSAESSPGTDAVASPSSVSEESIDLVPIYVGAVSAHPPSWQVQLTINGTTVPFKVDTGADVSVISEEVYNSLSTSPQLQPCRHVLVSAANTNLETLGLFSARLVFPTSGSSHTCTVYVARGLRVCLLGGPDSVALGLIKRLFSSDTASATPLSTAPEPSQSTDDAPGSYSSAPAGSEPLPLTTPGDALPQDILQEFPSLFSGLGSLNEPYNIELSPDAKPSCLYAARNIALPLRSKVATELQRMEQLGVIRPVVEPTDWCAAIVAAPKSNGTVGICADLKPLNEAVRRSHHQLPTVDETLGQIGDSTVFTKLDANSGFWQIPLDSPSQLLTTFITPAGRFCYTKLPFGISSAPEIFQQRMSKILAGLTLNPSKCEFAAPDLSFLGVRLTAAGIQPGDSKTSAIQRFRQPQTVSDIRRFMGLANQLGKFSPNLAALSQPLRELLSKGRAWTWGQPQQAAFDNIKAELCKPACLQRYDPNYDTKLSADASSYGLGAVLYQRRSSDDEWRPVACASRSLTSAERNYAQIEKEALAITWAVSRFDNYLLGMACFLIETDHKPLVPLLSTKRLHDLPARVLRFRLRLARYHYQIIHVPGSYLTSADALSRAPQDDSPSRDDITTQAECDVFATIAVENLADQTVPTQQVRDAQQQDATCQQLRTLILDGWPSAIRDVPQPLQIASLTSTTSARIIDHLHSIFARHGIPAVLRSDNGPQFSSAEFAQFATRAGFRQITSSPHYAQSNGEVERAVRTVKAFLKKSASAADLYDALLAYRSTPLSFAPYSPAELLMGRRLTTPVPSQSAQLQPSSVDTDAFRAADTAQRQKSGAQYDLRHRATILPALPPGADVIDVSTPGRRERGTVVARSAEPRSYIILLSSGQVRRTRHHLIAI